MTKYDGEGMIVPEAALAARNLHEVLQSSLEDNARALRIAEEKGNLRLLQAAQMARPGILQALAELDRGTR